MGKIIIELNTNNSAFEENESEVSRILSDLGERLEAGQKPESLRDSNGNKVGTVEYKEDDLND